MTDSPGARLGVEYVGLRDGDRPAGEVHDDFELTKGLTPPEAVQIDVIKWGDIWSYWDISIDPGYHWAQPDYARDSGKAGVGLSQWTHNKRGQFGFGGDGETTVVGAGSITYYFRKNVLMTELRCWENMTMLMRRDDGAVCRGNF